jgi:hypothetical protein
MPATVNETPELRGTEDLAREPLLVATLGLCLPFVYATWWFGTAVGELRDYGHDVGRERLARVSAGRAVAGMAVGWLLVVPAVVVMASTARRVQRAEAQDRSIGGAIAAIVAGQVGALACVLAGAAVLVPLTLLLSAVAVMGLLQPRLNAIWEAAEAVPLRPDQKWESVPLVPTRLPQWWSSWSDDAQESVGGFAVGCVLVAAGAGLFALGRLLAAEDRTGTVTGVVAAVAIAGLLVGTTLGIGSLLRQLADGRWTPRDASLDRAVLAAAALATATAAAWLWAVRPAYHGVLMPLYQWPLVTWIPIVIGLLFAAACAATRRTRAGLLWWTPVTVLVWGVFMVLLPGWQGHALYAATEYVPTGLPRSTQPRLLPKVAALGFASNSSLHDAHLVVDPSTRRLVWSAEQTAGTLRRGPSRDVTALALDDMTGSSDRVARGFDPAVSRVGPGSLQWRAYDRHYFTRVQDAVMVPGSGGEAVAVAPYLRYRGFPVRHPVWAGVYVYHQDGRVEDLTPQQALARPELAGSGRLYPERLARAVASAYGYKSGPGAALARRSRTEIDDPSGNPQPYLTNLGDDEVRWVTVAHPAQDDDEASAVFLTDGATGETTLWTPPRGTHLLSNEGAVAVTEQLPLQWEIQKDDGNEWVRKAVEPTPVFANGRLYYVVSIVANPDYVDTSGPVEQTAVVDATTRRIVERDNDDDPAASERLMAFFNP